MAPKTEIVQLPLATLVEDMDLYPRHAVDTAHVQSLVFALESGATLPPVVADKRSKKITDGWHRCRAYKRVLGPEAVIDVELIPYKSDAEMVIDAVARNAAHGRPFDAIDRTRSVVMLRTVGCTDTQIGLALRVPEKRVQKLMVKLASAPKSSGETIPGTNQVALKRSVIHLAGGTLTKSQAKTHGMMPGVSFLLIARQLTEALRESMVNMEDAKLVRGLIELRDTLVNLSLVEIEEEAA